MGCDLNNKIGSDSLGVESKQPEITFGGEFVREVSAGKEFNLVNFSEVAKGGPCTGIDPADESKNHV